jgi:lysophospholipase L1-like esterase
VRRRIGALALAVLLVACGDGGEENVEHAPVPDESERPPLPASMGSIGDSITQAANPDVLAIGGSNPHLSWATGDDPKDGTESHYERIRKDQPSIGGRNRNRAVSGARMADAPAQARQVVADRVEYVTFLMGANDVCRRSVSEMTAVDRFESDFRSSLTVLTEGLPEARVLVISIPDLHRLYELLKDDPEVAGAWRRFGICATVLGPATSADDREAARTRWAAFNDALERACGEFPRCRWDGGAASRHEFARDDVSSLDWFHPSRRGQQVLAEVTWKAGYWGES